MPQSLARVGVDSSVALLALFAPDPAAATRFVEFFATNIRNPNTRRAYYRAVNEFAACCEAADLRELRDIEPIHVAAYVENLQLRLTAPFGEGSPGRYSAIRMLFDWFVVGRWLRPIPRARRCAGRSIR
jgi:site-specific recombinase XerD